MLESDTFHALTLWSLIAMMIQFGIITGVTPVSYTHLTLPTN